MRAPVNVEWFGIAAQHLWYEELARKYAATGCALQSRVFLAPVSYSTIKINVQYITSDSHHYCENMITCGSIS